MALQTSGPISLLDVAAEFGGAAPHAMSEYYGAAPGVPASGVISLNDFYGKRSEVTVRLFANITSGWTNPQNASDGNLTTYSYSERRTSQMSILPAQETLVADYGDMYVKSVRCYARYRINYRSVNAEYGTAESILVMTSGTAYNGPSVINVTGRAYGGIAFNTIIVDDFTANAQINAKVDTLYSGGFNTTRSGLNLSFGGYTYSVDLYEYFVDLTLSAKPPL